MSKRLALWGLVALIVAGGLVLRWPGRGSRSGPAVTASEDAFASSPEPEAILREPVAPPEEVVPPPDTVGARTEVRPEPARPAPSGKPEPERPPPVEFLWYGRVVDGETRAPLAEASYDLVEGTPVMDGERTWSPVQADGVIELRCTGGSTLFVECAGYARGFASPRPRFGEPGNPQLVELLRSATVEVHVRDERGGETPAAAVQLRAPWMPFTEGSTSFPEHEPAWNAQQGRAGTLTFENLPPRVALTLEALEGGKSLHHEELWLQPGERREMELALYDGCTIAGRALMPEGTPVANQEIWLSAPGQDRRFDWSLDNRILSWVQRSEFRALLFVVNQTPADRTRTDDHGKFSFADVPPGDWLVGPAAEDPGEHEPSPDSIAPGAVPLTIQPGDRLVPVSLTCWRGLYIRGHVLDSEGRPLESTWVLVERPGFTTVALDDGDGSFTAGPLVPGVYSLVAYPTGGDSDCMSDAVEARAGQENVEVRLRAGGTVVATLFDGAGKPARAAQAWLISSAGEQGGWGTSFGETDKDGRVMFDGVSQGLHALVAVRGMAVVVRTGIAVEAGTRTEGLELTLQLGANLTIARPATGGANGYRVRRDGWLLADGSFDQETEPTEVVPAGDVVVELVQRRSETDVAVLEQKSVAVQAGATVRVEFSAPR